MTIVERESLVEAWEDVMPFCEMASAAANDSSSSFQQVAAEFGISYIVHVGAEAIADVQRSTDGHYVPGKSTHAKQMVLLILIG